tara:strand:+ start:442 stop:1380 length:939 start_codon:yes stop_codon:yes gene_type:complete
MKILLLGGSGFFGKSFLHYFQERIFPNDPSYTLIMASRNIDNIFSLVSPEYINKRVFLERIDVTSCPSIPKSDLVIHAATSTSEKDYIENPIKERVNIINGASNIIRLIDKKTSFMYISSGAIYGKQDSLELEFDENRTCSNQYKDKVKSVYAESKIEAEKIIQEYSKLNSINSTIARCFAFVGKHLPFESHFVIGNILHSIINNTDFEIKTNKAIYRTYMHSDDLVKSLLFINKFASSNCDIFNIGSNEVVEIHELANSLSSIYGFNVTGMRKIDKSITPDIYTPNISKLLSRGFNVEYDIRSSIKNIIND